MSLSFDSFFQNLTEPFKKSLKENLKKDHDENSS